MMYFDEQRKKVCGVRTHTHTHTHAMEYYSAIKNETSSVAKMQMELKRIMLSKISQSQKDTYVSTHMWNLRNKTDEHFGEKEYGQTIIHSLNYRKQTNGSQRGGIQGDVLNKC